MNPSIKFILADRTNWEDALKLKVDEKQKKFVPSPAESLASAYIKPWDEALDPYLIYNGDILIGMFYISYTPKSIDNYWIGGFFIDIKYQNKGLGKKSLLNILDFIPKLHPECIELKLTVEKENLIAQKLYKSLGFSDTAKVNSYGEIVYNLPVRDNIKPA